VIELYRIVWGITGSGDKLDEILDEMIALSNESEMHVTPIISKAGEQVLRWYKLWNPLNEHFKKVKMEVNANTPFIAGSLQIGKYDLLIVAPLTGNSTAKIAYGIADTLVTNAVAQTLKGNTPVLLYPVDQSSIPVTTKDPAGTEFTISPRAVDLENVRKLHGMKGISILKSPSEIGPVVRSVLHKKEAL
jgi:archaeoflavoprotein AfpA